MTWSRNGIGKTDAFLWRYDSTLLSFVRWDGTGGSSPGASSTQVAVSSLAGTVTTQPQSTVWAGNAGFHFDGSGNLNIAGSFAASTTVQVSSLAGKVTVDPLSTVWAVQMSQWSTTHNVSSLAGRVQVAPSDTNWASSAGFHFDGSGNLLTAGGAGGSSQVTISQFLDSSGGVVNPLDSANTAFRVNVVAGSAAGSTTVNVSSLAGKVLVDQNSTVWQIQMAQYSTTVQVSSLAGTVSVVQASTGTWSVLARNTDGIGNLLESSTRAQGTNSTMRGLSVRSLMPDSTNGNGIAASSGDVTVISSAANVGVYVYAYALSVASTVAITVRFLNGSTTQVWRQVIGGIGSTVLGGPTLIVPNQMAVTPPAYLFRSAANNALVMNASSSGVNYSVAAWRE